MAEYNAEELLTKRERVSSDIKLDLERRAGEFGLVHRTLGCAVQMACLLAGVD